MIINIKIAKALGLTIPPGVLAVAEHVTGCGEFIHRAREFSLALAQLTQEPSKLMFQFIQGARVEQQVSKCHNRTSADFALLDFSTAWA